jgi:hypothetical protein
MMQCIRSISAGYEGVNIANRKSTTLTIRIDSALKEGLRIAAEREHRSITNMIEILIRAHCEREGIPNPARASTPRAQDRY